MRKTNNVAQRRRTNIVAVRRRNQKRKNKMDITHLNKIKEKRFRGMIWSKN